MKKVIIFIVKLWLFLIGIGCVLLIVEDLTEQPSGTTIIRGEYKVWKPTKWKTPSFPTKK